MTPPREVFERWVQSTHQGHDFRREPDGEYVDHTIGAMWRAWMAGWKCYEEGWSP